MLDILRSNFVLVGARVEALRGSMFCGERVDCMIIDHGTK